MLTFHVTLHARSDQAVAGPMIELRGRSTATLLMNGEALAQPFGVTFEQAFAALEQLPRMFIEPDGSFVWVSGVGPRVALGETAVDDTPGQQEIMAPGQSPGLKTPWQLDGVLYDRDGRLLLVDLKGSCPLAALDQLLSCFGWPATAIVFQITQSALFIDEHAFRDFASRRDP